MHRIYVWRGTDKTGYDRESVLSESYAGIILTAVIGATPLPVRLYGRLQKKKGLKQTLDIAEILLLVMLLLLCVAFLVDGSFNPFLYFRF